MCQSLADKGRIECWMKNYSVCSVCPTVLGAPFKVGGRVGGGTNMALVIEAGMHTLKVK